jgi:hypothetical protein
VESRFYSPDVALKYGQDLDPIIPTLRMALLELTFFQAINIPEGRVIGGPGILRLLDSAWGSSQMPHRLLTSGMLDPRQDDRFEMGRSLVRHYPPCPAHFAV